MLRLSVVIPTKNCVDLLRQTIAALDFVDEIVVVDMFSTDGTAELVRSHPKGRLIQRNGYIYENVNRGFDAATGDWLLRLDSDEVPTPELGQEIRERIASAPSDLCGFFIPNRTYFSNRWLRYGPAYDERSPVPGERYRLCLFRKGTARFESELEHTDLTIAGRCEYLKHRYDHYSVRSFSHYLAKQNYYTDMNIERMNVNAFQARHEAWAMLWGPIKEFLVFFLKRKGYKDGPLGIVACGGYAIQRFMLHAKRWERLTAAQNDIAEPERRKMLEQATTSHLTGSAENVMPASTPPRSSASVSSSQE
jgi:glycosyltransferase involved in cell wall biosynthesis